jgi:hypothetical protein
MRKSLEEIVCGVQHRILCDTQIGKACNCDRDSRIAHGFELLLAQQAKALTNRGEGSRLVTHSQETN